MGLRVESEHIRAGRQIVSGDTELSREWHTAIARQAPHLIEIIREWSQKSLEVNRIRIATARQREINSVSRLATLMLGILWMANKKTYPAKLTRSFLNDIMNGPATQDALTHELYVFSEELWELFRTAAKMLTLQPTSQNIALVITIAFIRAAGGTPEPLAIEDKQRAVAEAERFLRERKV